MTEQLMPYANEVLAVISLLIFLPYLRRAKMLSFWEHDPQFVAFNSMMGTCAGYSVFVFWDIGVRTLPLVASASALLYLFISRRTFVWESTGMGEFDSRAVAHRA